MLKFKRQNNHNMLPFLTFAENADREKPDVLVMESRIGIIMIKISQTEVFDGIEPDVIVLSEGDYSSLRTEEWRRHFRRIEEGLKDAKSSLVIVDLDGVHSYGASFLGALVNLANCLNLTGVRLQVRGDRCGLLELVGLEGKLSGSAGTGHFTGRSGGTFAK